MGLNPEQKKAVEYLEGPHLVIAGPGTGKTQLLSEKVKYILQNTDASAENILCLTFTETGAFNMRERLKGMIGNDATKVTIGTYHSFGTDILNQYKNYSETYDRKIDKAIDEVTQYKIIKDIQDKLPATDILRGDAIKDIIETITNAKEANLSADDLELIAKQNIADSKAISDLANVLLKNIIPRQFAPSLNNAYKPFYEELKKYEDIDSITKNVDRSIKNLLKTLKNALLDATETGKITPLSKWTKDNFEKDENDNFVLKDRIANKKLSSLANVMRKYEENLRENGLYDFCDMIEEAIKALKSDKGFKLTLEERYQYILLDEFQDTNPSQFEIIKELTDYEKPIIMAVGDDDQAIFSFQGASSDSFSIFQKHFNAETIILKENYRSTQEILDFAKTIADQINETERFGIKNLHAFKGNSEKTEIERHEFISSDAEYSYVAGKISELIKNGVKQTDIAVIAPKHKYLIPMLPFFKDYDNINISYDKCDSLLDDEKIHEIITIAKLINELSEAKAPRTNILEILSYPFWNLDILKVIKSVNRAKDDKKAVLDYLTDSDDENLQKVAKFIADLVAKSFTTPLEIMIDYIIGTAELNGFRSNFLNYHENESEYGKFELFENLATLRDKINTHFGERNPKLSDLVELVKDYEDATMQISSTSPYRESENAVSLMSAHKSKGLEFEYVFIIAADHMAWGKGKGNNNKLTLPKNLIQIRHTGTTEGERMRLLYVAMTRAKKHLIITNALKDFNDKSSERLEYLGEHEEKLDDGTTKIAAPNLPAKYINCHYEAVDKKDAKSIKNWLDRYIIPSPDMEEIYKERVKNYMLTASNLTNFIDIIYGGPQDFFNKTILHGPTEPTTIQIEFGNCIHETYEYITNNPKTTDEEAIKFFLEKVDKVSLEPEDITKLREKGVHDLEISLKAFGEILRAGKAEVNLYSEHPTLDNVPLTGKIDHILIDDINKTIEIYDFKTGNYHKEKWDSQATLYKYKMQLGFYKLLLNLSPSYAKYKIEKGHILFVSPDKDETVHDKVYEYNDADEKELKNLITAVYNQIKTLNFYKDPEIFLPKNQNATIKDIKNFVGLLIDKSIER